MKWPFVTRRKHERIRRLDRQWTMASARTTTAFMERSAARVAASETKAHVKEILAAEELNIHADHAPMPTCECSAHYYYRAVLRAVDLLPY